jgi:hypothetical protein
MKLGAGIHAAAVHKQDSGFFASLITESNHFHVGNLALRTAVRNPKISNLAFAPHLSGMSAV